ncbi:hypothetical protein HDV03_003218 [Kappamyces sp. JEL0829]|nr:hypothetical protein HDV03_003218 [Kappamyces sp. JEL0829]
MLQEIEAKVGRSTGQSVQPLPSASGKKSVPAPRPTLSSINPALYGIGHDPSLPPVTFDPAVFQVSKEFQEANRPTIGVGKLGEWEEYIEPVSAPLESRIASPEPEQQGQPTLVQSKEFEDEEEGVSKKDVVGFQVLQKTLGIDEDAGPVHDDDLVFKKKKSKKSAKT